MSSKIRRAYTRYFIPFQIKELDYSDIDELEKECTPDKRIWGSHLSEKEIKGKIRHLLPFAHELFTGSEKECLIYKLQDSDELKVSNLLKKRYHIKNTDYTFNISEMELYFFPTKGLGVLMIELETSDTNNMNNLLFLNNRMKKLREGKVPVFCVLPKDKDDAHPMKVKKTKPKPFYLDASHEMKTNQIRKKLWEKQGDKFAFNQKNRNRLLKNLEGIQKNGMEGEENIVYPGFKLLQICEILCGDLFEFEKNKRYNDVGRELREYWRHLIPNGRARGLVYVNTKYDFEDEEKRFKQKKKDLFHLRHLYDRSYTPSKESLRFKENPEVINEFDDTAMGVSFEGVAILDEKDNSLHFGSGRNHYTTMVLLSLVMRWRLINISDDLINLEKQRAEKKEDEVYIKRLKEVRNKVMYFDISTRINQISEVSHINKLYKKFNRLLGIEDYFQELKRSIKEVDEYLKREGERKKRERDREREKLSKVIQWILFVFFPITASASIFKAFYYAFDLGRYSSFFLRFVLLGVGLAVALLTYFLYYTFKTKEFMAR